MIIVKLESVETTIFCDGCFTTDTAHRSVKISEHSIDVLDVTDLPKGWMYNMVFMVKSKKRVYCPPCVKRHIEEDGWVLFQKEPYVGPGDEDTWFGIEEKP